MSPTARTLRIGGAGVAVVLSYVLVALATLGPDRPLRPFFDGTSPAPPFRYVNPPPDHVEFNTPPEPTVQTIPFVEREVVDGGTERMFEGGSVGTPDGQVSLSVPSGVFANVPDQTGVTVSINPLDPDIAGQPAPDGLEFEGNAVEITARLEPSLEPVEPVEQDCSLGGCISVIMRYPIAATQLWRLDGDTWFELDAQNAFQSQSLFSSTERLGIFATTVISGPSGPLGMSLREVIAMSLGGVAVIVLVVFQRMRGSKRSRATATNRRRPPAKGAKGRPGQHKRPRSQGATRGKRRR